MRMAIHLKSNVKIIMSLTNPITQRRQEKRAVTLSDFEKSTYSLQLLKHFRYYSNSILYTFKFIQHIHYMVIYTITSCIILYSKSFTYILYSFWSHCEYILSTSILISSTITIKEWE